jgi:hypothetical protein
LREAVRLSVTAICSGQVVTVEVAVSNVGVGHVLPSGPGQPALMLEIGAEDRNRAPLSWRAGSTQLQLHPFATDVSRYRFLAPEGGPVQVTARLVLAPSTGPAVEIASTKTICSFLPTNSGLALPK